MRHTLLIRFLMTTWILVPLGHFPIESLGQVSGSESATALSDTEEVNTQSISAGDVQARVNLPLRAVNFRQESGEQRIIHLDARQDPRQPVSIRRSSSTLKRWLAIGAGAAGAVLVGVLAGGGAGASVTATVQAPFSNPAPLPTPTPSPAPSPALGTIPTPIPGVTINPTPTPIDAISRPADARDDDNRRRSDDDDDDDDD